MATAASTSIAQPISDIGYSFEELSLEAQRMGFVGLRIAPVLEVPRKSGIIGLINLKQMLQPRTTERNPDGSYRRISGDGGTLTYLTQDHGLEEVVDDATDAQYADLWDSQMLAAERTLHGVLQAHEERVISAALGISNTAAAGGVWTTTTTDVVAKVQERKNAVRLKCGVTPNCLCADKEIIDKLLINDSVQEMFVGSDSRTPRDLRLVGLAAALGLDEVIESNSVKNANTAAQAASLSATWDRTKALLFVKYDGPDMRRQAQFMRTIHWGADGSGIGGTFETYRDEKVRADIIRHRMETQEKVVFEDAAEVITGVAA